MKYETFAVVTYIVKLWMLQSCQCSWGSMFKKHFLEFFNSNNSHFSPSLCSVKQSYGSFVPGRCQDALLLARFCSALLTASLRDTNERFHHTVASDLSSCNSFRKHKWRWIAMEFHNVFLCAQTCQVISISREIEMIWGNLERCSIQQQPDFFLSSALFVCAVLDWALCPRREMTQGPDSTFLLELMLLEKTLGTLWAEFCPCSIHRNRFCAEFCPCHEHRSKFFFPIYLWLPYLSFCILPLFFLSASNNRCLNRCFSGCTIWMDFKYMDLDTPLFLVILSV